MQKLFLVLIIFIIVFLTIYFFSYKKENYYILPKMNVPIIVEEKIFTKNSPQTQNITVNNMIENSIKNLKDSTVKYSMNFGKSYSSCPDPLGYFQPISFPEPNATYVSTLNCECNYNL